jgi:hypothetical protein
MASRSPKKMRPLPKRRATTRKPRLPKYDPTAKPIWEIAEEIAATVPDSEWAKVPPDLSKNVDHYLYGAPKDEE